MEQRFDGASLQYSINDGVSWNDLGAYNEPPVCLNQNWYNYSPITYLSPLSSSRNGWSGNIQATSGSCQGGNGSNGWVTASHIMPELAGASSVIFRFTFGAGTICNNFDGFAVDEIEIGEAPANLAAFTSSCIANKTIQFTDASTPCPTGFGWDFGDPASGLSNTSTLKNPRHVFTAPGTYTVTLSVTGGGSASSTITHDVTVLGAAVTLLTPADCINNNGGSGTVSGSGGSGAYTYQWNSTPVQNTATAINLASGEYQVITSESGACPDTSQLIIPLDNTCIGIYFPAAFTPNNDGRNDDFGPLGSIPLLKSYSLSIFNRWGQRVFHSTNPFEKWDGRMKGADPGTNIFTWYARYELPGEGKVLRKGTILLIR